MTAERTTAFRLAEGLLRTMNKPIAGRAQLDATNPVDWDDEPTFYQATTIAHGHILHIKSAA